MHLTFILLLKILAGTGKLEQVNCCWEFVPILYQPVGPEQYFLAANNSVHCRAQVELHGKTGVEMEALTAVQVGLLTIYDMCKAVDRGMVMTNVRVLEKHGGKSGDWTAQV